MTARPMHRVATLFTGRVATLILTGVTLLVGKVELGQGVLTALAVIAADELGLELSYFIWLSYFPNRMFDI
mgnify:CR=1 FL=1